MTRKPQKLTSQQRRALADIRFKVDANFMRIAASLDAIQASGQRLADGSLRSQVIAETRLWVDAQPELARAVAELFLPL